ncbi:MAG: hypothetical protein OXR73_09050 [Myxococcales bacterium]|nr:hypothetical protein [Myxococcales bacterium]
MTRMPYTLGYLLLLTTAAPAQAEPPARADDLVTEYAFEDDQVHADLRGPLGEVLQVRRTPRGDSLIRIREHFIDRLLYAIEDL